MAVHDSLKTFILEQVLNPREEEIKEVLSLFEEKSFQKGEFFKKPFTSGPDVAFLSEGAVRIIIYKESGEEVTARIRQENSFLFDPFRMKGLEVSPLGIECLTDLSLLVMPIVDMKRLLETNFVLNVIIRKHIMEQLSEVAQSQYLFLTGTAKDRYKFILEKNPGLLKKFPLYFIASMIGITPTQLSRIRNKK